MSKLHCTKADKKYLEQFFIETILIEPKWQTMQDIWWHPLPYKMAALQKKGFCINFCWKCGTTATKTWDALRETAEFIQDTPVVLQFYKWPLSLRMITHRLTFRSVNQWHCWPCQWINLWKVMSDNQKNQWWTQHFIWCMSNKTDTWSRNEMRSDSTCSSAS
jgi:hypothetical protein